ncbi:MAG: SNF2-related protein [Desulfobacula sp.]|nr:SNF2-related protein [Desulfobacula sp.]
MLSRQKIKADIADSNIIFYRGVKIYENNELLYEGNDGNKLFEFRYDGNYGDYEICIDISNEQNPGSCSCPYPGDGCKHIVASLLMVYDITFTNDKNPDLQPRPEQAEEMQPYLTYDEIKTQAMDDRQKRAKKETFTIIQGDSFKGEHLIETTSKKQYLVVMHNPESGKGHCSCPDFLTNKLNTCKHIIFLKNHFSSIKGFKKQLEDELFPFIDIFWDSKKNAPKLFFDPQLITDHETLELIAQHFNNDGDFIKKDLSVIVDLAAAAYANKQIIIQPEVLIRTQIYLQNNQLQTLNNSYHFDYSKIKGKLYDYQKEGVEFCLFKKSVLIGDEMGLGKTLQAITLSILKKELFGFKKVLIITLASIKDQWKREITTFTDEVPMVVQGTAQQRKHIYNNNSNYFKITNYEAVLRDITIISKMKPDLIILDEAQRIKNFNTKTADAVKQLPRDHAIILTGTPLENKLEDVYSIIQFLDPYLVSPLWDFAGRHFMISRTAKGKIIGYQNLDILRDKLEPIVIRRKKDEVLKDLPETVTNNYYINLSQKQDKIHSGFMSALIPILSKKFLTPIDLQRIQMLLLKMRMVCNSTYLIDKKTNISPKLDEFKLIIEELVNDNNRKVVVFSEWTTMTFLVAKYLSDAKISFIELSGKVPVKKRQKLIDEFTNNPECKIFLSTDAGGTGLNLQAADCVINFELPWNPAKLSQRTGRVNRIGQKSKCINVINLIAKNSIEEKIFSGIQMKTDLFESVFENGSDFVDFSNEKKTGLINRLREMMDEDQNEMAKPEPIDPVIIPEDTPYYLNPKVLNTDIFESEKEILTDKELDYTAEEPDTTPGISNDETKPEPENIFANQSTDKIETVLNSGMEFIGGLMEMATGQKLDKSENQEKMLTIDKNTGEVTMKFKLPGFS